MSTSPIRVFFWTVSLSAATEPLTASDVELLADWALRWRSWPTG